MSKRPLGDAMREAVVSLIGSPADVILRLLMAAYPRSIERTEVARHSGYTNIKSAAFAGAVAKLVRMARDGALVAEAKLFPAPKRGVG